VLFVKEGKDPISADNKAHTHRRLIGLALGVRGFIPWLGVLSLAIAGVVIVQALLLSKVIDTMVFGSGNPPMVWWIWLVLLVFCRFMLIWVRERLARRKAVAIKSELRSNLFSHLLKVGNFRAQNQKTGTLVATVTNGVEKLEDYFTKYIPTAIHIIILPVVVIVFTISYDWISGLIMALTGPLFLFFMFLIGTHAGKITRRQWHEHGNLSARFLDTLQGLKTIRVFGAGSLEQQVIAHESERYRVLTMGVLRIAFISGFVLEMAASISIALVAVQVGIRLIEGLMAYQAGLFILLLAPEFYLPFRLLGAHHHAGMEGAASAASIFEHTDTPLPKVAGERIDISARAPSITFSGVTYTYPNSGVAALKGLNGHMPGGALTAVVGPSGAGKSTLVAMLLGMLQPDTGAIEVDGIPLHELETSHWLRRVAWVPQHPHFFNASLLENLRMAAPQATVEEVEEAAERAGAHQFIRNLTNGYHTLLSDNASRLSGGEKQRLAIARAFLKDAPLLILDEPTSNLDPESEHHIARATEALIHSRTTLIVAHRLKTVQMAQQIMVMDGGVVAETGTHQELMVQQGIYSGFINTLKINKQKGS
jgi:ATP-binding cassette, subfamily C, bacterial CydD